MPARDPNKVQLDFPQLNADLIAQLRLTGTIGVMDFDPKVVPVFIIGDRNLTIEAQTPVWRSSEIVNGFVNTASTNQVIADTGQLPAGDYDIYAALTHWNHASAAAHLALEHRNAANNATLAVLLDLGIAGTPDVATLTLAPMGYRLDEDERLRAIMLISGSSASSSVTATIGFKLRPVP